VEVSGRLRKVTEVSENAKIKCFNFAAEIDTPKEILDTPKENSITPKVTLVLTF
jgi:hypothetical protein